MLEIKPIRVGLYLGIAAQAGVLGDAGAIVVGPNGALWLEGVTAHDSMPGGDT